VRLDMVVVIVVVVVDEKRSSLTPRRANEWHSEKLGVEKVVVLYGVLETNTEYGIETVL
jgi:hypothetical protein